MTSPSLILSQSITSFLSILTKKVESLTSELASVKESAAEAAKSAEEALKAAEETAAKAVEDAAKAAEDAEKAIAEAKAQAEIDIQKAVEEALAQAAAPKYEQPELNPKVKSIIEVDGYQFIDLNANGELDVYEDWRLDAETRADDLVAQMTLREKIAQMQHPTFLPRADGKFPLI